MVDIKQYAQAQKLVETLPPHLVTQLSLVHMKRDDILMTQNAMDDGAFYLILSGVCESEILPSTPMNTGVYYLPMKLEKGSFVGLREALQSQSVQRLAQISAKTDVVALKFPRSILLDLAEVCPQTLLDIWAETLASSWLRRNITSTHRGISPEATLASHLLQLYQIYSGSCYKDGHDAWVKIMDTREELSLLSNCSVRTINRAISRLKEEGYLSIRGGKIYMCASQYQAMNAFVEIQSGCIN